MPKHTESDFESAIEAGLTGSGGYESRAPSAYDETLALLPGDVSGFLKDSQPAKWAALEALLGPKTAATVLDSLSKELNLKGTLHVLRHGFKCHGKTLRMAWFQPNTTMNPEAAENYARNRLTVTRQAAFTSVMKKADGKNRRRVIDVTLAVNGIPVVTAELKNPLTGQRAADAVRQYKEERDGRDLLFAFKKRALVHFAVDPDEVWMTTRLRGKDTYFLPFNRGDNQGAGNPPVEGNWRTHYLWDEALQADSLLEILQRFMHLEVKETEGQDRQGRAHRPEGGDDLSALSPARRRPEARRARPGQRLRPELPGPAFDRFRQIELHRVARAQAGQPSQRARPRKCFTPSSWSPTGACSTSSCSPPSTSSSTRPAWWRRSTRTPKQLAKALSQGTPIVITTIQKFPFISQALSTLGKKGSGVRIDTAGKRFAVIVDEAHSSQSGETATVLRGMLNKEGIEAAIAAQLSDEEDDDLSDEAKAAVLRDALRRARQPNLSFFAFTATPKFKTKALFDEPGPTGASPFHEYTMRQAIEEGLHPRCASELHHLQALLRPDQAGRERSRSAAAAGREGAGALPGASPGQHRAGRFRHRRTFPAVCDVGTRRAREGDGRHRLPPRRREVQARLRPLYCGARLHRHPFAGGLLGNGGGPRRPRIVLHGSGDERWIG